jgi:hypothetical protein
MICSLREAESDASMIIVSVRTHRRPFIIPPGRNATTITAAVAGIAAIAIAAARHASTRASIIIIAVGAHSRALIVPLRSYRLLGGCGDSPRAGERSARNHQRYKFHSRLLAAQMRGGAKAAPCRPATLGRPPVSPGFAGSWGRDNPGNRTARHAGAAGESFKLSRAA